MNKFIACTRWGTNACFALWYNIYNTQQVSYIPWSNAALLTKPEWWNLAYSTKRKWRTNWEPQTRGKRTSVHTPKGMSSGDPYWESQVATRSMPASLHRAVHSLFCTCTLLFEMQVCSFCGQISTSCSEIFLTPPHKPIQNATNYSRHHKAAQNRNCGELMTFERSKTTPMSFPSFAPLNKTNISSYSPHWRCHTTAWQAV